MYPFRFLRRIQGHFKRVYLGGAERGREATRFSLKSQSPVMRTSLKKRGAIGKLDKNGATAAAMNLVTQHHAKTCVVLWERRVARLGVGLVRIPGQRFFVF